MKFICQKCQKEYAPVGEAYRCHCGGLFKVGLDCNQAPLDFAALSRTEHTLWRYMGSMPFQDDVSAKLVSMGEGFTPLIPLNPNSGNLLAKCDYFMPTLSFKDRGAAVLIAYAKMAGVKNVVCDSSGNAGTSIAAYSARAGIVCDVFVPEATSDKKIQQIRAHNANVHKIPGSREDTAAAAIDAVKKTKAFYASHIFNPLFYEGTKTYFFEVFEQLGQMPECFIIPTGNGTLLLGAARAFAQMLDWGIITKMPRILSVQAENCAPVYQSFANDDASVAAVENKGTLAEGIAIAAPARGEDMLAAIRATKGDVITVSDDEVLAAREEMALFGVYVEITAAANYAGYKKYIQKYPELSKQKIVMPLCGAGIKSS